MSFLDDFKYLSQSTQKMACNPNLTKKDCEDILAQIIDASQSTMEKLQNLNTPQKTLQELKKKCSLIANHSLSASEFTYEAFTQSDDFICLVDETEMLNRFETILPHIFTMDEPDFNLLRVELINMNTLYEKTLTQATLVLGNYKQLVTEITNYSNTVNEVRSKNRLSPDWSGKKQPLMTLGQQLTMRREDFLVTEHSINKEIQALCNIYPELHNTVQSHCHFFTAELDKKLDMIASDHTAQTRKVALKNTYQEILTIKSNLENFLIKMD